MGNEYKSSNQFRKELQVEEISRRDKIHTSKQCWELDQLHHTSTCYQHVEKEITILFTDRAARRGDLLTHYEGEVRKKGLRCKRKMLTGKKKSYHKKAQE